ncbi:MAG: extracellular solute-binding protein [Chloroflexota bacterium]
MSNPKWLGWVQQIQALALLLGLLLSACLPAAPAGPQPTPQPQATNTRPVLPTQTATPNLTPTPDPLAGLRGLQITFAHPWVGDLSRLIDQQVDRFNQTNEWGLHVIVQRGGSSMALAQQIESASDPLPDLLVAPSENLLYWHLRTDKLRPLNDLLLDEHWGLSEGQRADFPLVFWQQDQQDGNQLGIPAQRAPRVFFYNLSWASELGFSRPPDSLEAFREHACAAARANNADPSGDNDGSGGWMVDTDGWTIYAWLESWGLENPLQGDPPRLTFSQPATLQAAEFLRGMVDEGCAFFGRIPPEEAFATRRALYFSTSLLDLPILSATMTRLGSNDVWMALPFPSSNRPVVIVSGLSYGILRSQPEREMAAWLFLRWMLQPEVQARVLHTGGGFPIGAASANLAQAELRTLYPAWGATLQWIPFAQPTPPSGEWRIARFVLEDAFWHVLQSYLPVSEIPRIVSQIDPTVREVLEARAGTR